MMVRLKERTYKESTYSFRQPVPQIFRGGTGVHVDSIYVRSLVRLNDHYSPSVLNSLRLTTETLDLA